MASSAWQQGLSPGDGGAAVIVSLSAFPVLGTGAKAARDCSDASLPSLPAHPLGLGVLSSSLLLLFAPDHQKFAALRAEILRVES